MTGRTLRPRRTFEVARDVVLLAEGKDEVDLISYLLTPAERSVVQVHDCGGRDNLLAHVLEAVDSGTFPATGRALMAVTDADDDPEAAFAAVCSALALARLAVPEAPATVAHGRRVSTGVFITPGAAQTGAVEQLLLAAADPRRRRLAEDYLVSVASQKFDRSVVSPPKAELQALLAGLPDSPRQPGDALQRSGLIHDRAPLEPLQEFLRSVIRSALRPLGAAARPDSQDAV